jgi:hypothetical protein
MAFLRCLLETLNYKNLHKTPQRRPGEETPPRSTKDVILLTIKLSIGDVLGPDGARRKKEKSDPGRDALM